MSKPSQWPLTKDAVRLITPRFMVEHLRQHPLTQDCYPTAAGYYPKAKGHTMERQQHDDNLLIYCMEGSGDVATPYCERSINKGEVLILPEGVPHKYAADTTQPWTIFWFHFDGNHAGALIDDLEYTHATPVLKVGLLPLLTSDLRRLLSLRQCGYRQSTYYYGGALIRQILNYLALEIRSSRYRRRQTFDFNALESLMLENLDSELDLDTLAASANLSRHHFSTKYKQLTGLSPIKHFIHLKMERACHLLDSSNDSVTDVCAQVGYQDPLYFSRQFRKVIGMSPREYRKRQQG